MRSNRAKAALFYGKSAPDEAEIPDPDPVPYDAEDPFGSAGIEPPDRTLDTTQPPLPPTQDELDEAEDEHPTVSEDEPEADPDEPLEHPDDVEDEAGFTPRERRWAKTHLEDSLRRMGGTRLSDDQNLELLAAELQDMMGGSDE